MDKWTLADIAEDSIKQLESDGVKLSAQDILTIQRLALCAQGDIDLDSGKPVYISGIWLRQITIAGETWLEEFAEAYPEDAAKQRMAVAYALANGNKPFEHFGAEAWKDVKQFSKKLNCTNAELENAILEVFGDSATAGLDEDGKGKAENIVLMCCALVGGEPDSWRYQMSLPAVQRLILTRIALNTSNGRSSKDDEKLAALRELGKFEHALREKLKNGELDQSNNPREGHRK